MWTETHQDGREPGGRWFATTHWSVVLTAGDDHASRSAQARALEALCRAYWYPLYAYVRRRGHNADEAQDFTQAFFERVIERNYLGQVDQQKGKFRSFLIAALNHFLADEWDRARRQKRGGGQAIIALDGLSVEDRYRLEPVDAFDPERLYERRWALTLLERVLARLRDEFTTNDNARTFEALRGFLLGDKAASTYAQAGDRLGMTEGAARIAVHRMRRRYQELFRSEIAHTVATPDQIEDEINHVFAVLG